MSAFTLLLILPSWGADQALDGSSFPWGPLTTATRPCNPQPIPQAFSEVPEGSAACTVQGDEPIAIGPLTCDLLSYSWAEHELATVVCKSWQADDDVRKALRKAFGPGKREWALENGKAIRLMPYVSMTFVVWYDPLVDAPTMQFELP